MSDVLERLYEGAVIECGPGVICTIKKIYTTRGYYSFYCYFIRYLRDQKEFELSVELYEIGNEVVVTYHKLNYDSISNDLDLLNAMRLNTFNSDEDKDLFLKDSAARSVLTSPWGLVSLLIWNDRLNMNKGLDEGFMLFPQYVYGYLPPSSEGVKKPMPPGYVYRLGDYLFSLVKKHVNNSEMTVLSVDLYQNVCYIGYSRFHEPYSLKLVRRGDSIFSSCWYARKGVITSVDDFISLLALNDAYAT